MGTLLSRWHYDPAVRSNEIRLTYIETAPGLWCDLLFGARVLQSSLYNKVL